MEQKNILLSALSVGIGVGVGIGLASGQTVSRWAGGGSVITPLIMEQEMVNLIANGKDSKVTFDQFPYYLSPLRGLSRRQRWGECLECLDPFPCFSLRRKTKAHCVDKAVEQILDQNGSLKATNLRRNASASANLNNLTSYGSSGNLAPLTRNSSWSFDEKLLIQTLYKVLVKVSKTSPIVLYLRDVEKVLCRSEKIYVLFQKMLKKLSGAVLILGSRIVDPGNDYREIDERLSSIFPYNLEIKPPEDETHLVSWKSQLEEDMKMIQFQDNRNHIMEVLSANDIECEDLGSICMSDTMVLRSLLTDVTEGLTGILILKRCLSRFHPLPEDWFKFSLKGNWLFDVLLGCLMFPLVNRLSQFNLDLLPVLPSTPVTLSSVEQSILARDPVAMALYALVLVVCAPLWEEIVFRGFLLPSLTKYMPVWCSILMSSIAFALAHFNVQRMLPLIFLGVVMGVIYGRSRNLLPSILLHSLWNGFVFLDLMK